MARFGIAPSPVGARRKIATAFAAAGALLLSSGMVVAAAPGALAAPGDNNGKAVGADNGNKGKGNNNAGGNGGNSGGGNGNGGGGGGNAGGGNGNGGNAGGGGNGGSNANVAICHRRAGDKNPYSIMYVAPNSTVLEAHLDHKTDDDGKGEDKYWKSAGVWNGVPHAAGQYKPDYFFGDPGTPRDIEEFEAWCLSKPSSGGDDEVELTLTVTPVVCSTLGSVTRPSNPEGVTYTITNGQWTGLSGAVSGSATAGEALRLVDNTPDSNVTWTISSDGKSATYLAQLGSPRTCVDAKLAAIEATAITKCGTWGSVSRPPNGDGVNYAISGGAWTRLQGTPTVTATAMEGYTIPATAGWTVALDGKSATRDVPLGSFSKCTDEDDDTDDTLVAPLYPRATDATCSRDGRLRVPNQPTGVEMERSGSVPGPVTFTFAPAKGYAFPAGTDREVTVTVPARLTGEDCIKGVETSKPKPQPGTHTPVNDGPGAQPVKGDAEVLGEQAIAVPTAVAAGLGDTMTATTTGSPQLAQALMAGGLLMLVMGGATGLGRRTRGAHES